MRFHPGAVRLKTELTMKERWGKIRQRNLRFGRERHSFVTLFSRLLGFPKALVL